MGAENPIRRQRTAREMAEQFGVTPRAIRNIVAEPRAEFLARAEQRRAKAIELRAAGLKYREIAEEMGLSIGMVSRVIHDARKQRQDQSTEKIRHAG